MRLDKDTGPNNSEKTPQNPALFQGLSFNMKHDTRLHKYNNQHRYRNVLTQLAS